MNKADEGREITYQIHKTVFLLDKLSEQALQARAGFGLSQFLVMHALASLPKVPQKFVAASLGQTQAAVSRQVDILVSRKLVSRDRNPDNRREYVLGLTKAGQRRYRQALQAMDDSFGRLFAIWSKKQKAVLLDALLMLLSEIKRIS